MNKIDNSTINSIDMANDCNKILVYLLRGGRLCSTNCNIIFGCDLEKNIIYLENILGIKIQHELSINNIGKTNILITYFLTTSQIETILKKVKNKKVIL